MTCDICGKKYKNFIHTEGSFAFVSVDVPNEIVLKGIDPETGRTFKFTYEACSDCINAINDYITRDSKCLSN